ncbi:MAG: phage major capsid protein, partial [Desulfuromonadaceae bacterium]|nr:phage major capsid protein [Desulfuromonadaceae bacterium]
SVETLAHWIPAPKQVLDDVAMLSSYLGTRLIEGLKYKEEQALLYGTGDGVTIKGINVQASSFNTTNLGELLDTNSTIIDVLRVALLQAELAEHDADAIVLNPIDWTKIELLKDSNGNYLYANPHVLNPRGLWGKSVVSTKTMTANNYLVGAFASGAMGWDREQVNVRVSTEDRDNFVKNMVTILCEERLGLTVFRPEAFVKGALVAG